MRSWRQGPLALDVGSVFPTMLTYGRQFIRPLLLENSWSDRGDKFMAYEAVSKQLAIQHVYRLIVQNGKKNTSEKYLK